MRTKLICVGHLITKILIEIAQGHISLSGWLRRRRGRRSRTVDDDDQQQAA
jgi:hypothetical protein